MYLRRGHDGYLPPRQITRAPSRRWLKRGPQASDRPDCNGGRTRPQPTYFLGQNYIRHARRRVPASPSPPARQTSSLSRQPEEAHQVPGRESAIPLATSPSTWATSPPPSPSALPPRILS